MLVEGVRDRHGPHAFAAYGGNMAGKDAALSRYSGLMLASSGIQQVYSSGTVDQHPKNLSAMLMFGHDWKIPVPDLDSGSEERRVGKACVSTVRSRWSADT